ncbi:mechanosensitive ion channel family protein [Paenibacillus sp. Sa2BVA9]|uniref:Mechanosensitive ion channel family protein n=1 Tax=Paenibacillus gallinarum TaxID=2762232 RepID=A0ABR8T2H6_9BACL|nr:mechanosensitive ion channel family protein [Paenibacillus gallinarum]
MNELFGEIKWIRLAISLLFLFVFTIFNKWTSTKLFHLLKRIFSQKWDSIYQLLHGPARALMTLVGISGAVRFYFADGGASWPLFQGLVRTGFIIIIGWAFYNLSGRSSRFFAGMTSKLGVEESDMIIPFLSKVLRFMVIALTITIIMGEWGYSVNGLVAGLGLGSLAVALAAQDTLSNLIAGIIIVTEKPFSKGDWIRTDAVEGMVEDISFRSSKIRTFADSIVIIPNNILAKAAITNWSRMGKRRVTFDLGVAIDTDRVQLANAVNRLREYIENHEGIDHDLYMVRLKEMTKDQITILFYFFTYTTIWVEHMKVLESINFEILRILEEEGVKLAVPAQRLFLENHAIFEKEAADI